MTHLQRYGKGTGTPEDFEQSALVEANHAREQLEVKQALETVREVLSEIAALDMDNGMDDEARFKLKLAAARQLNEIGKTKFEFSRDMHIPIEVMKLWVVDIINLFQEICVDRSDYEKAVRKFKEIMSRTRNSEFMMAEAEASGERKEVRVG